MTNARYIGPFQLRKVPLSYSTTQEERTFIHGVDDVSAYC